MMDAVDIVLMVAVIVLSVLVGLGIIFGLVFVVFKRVAQRGGDNANHQHPGAKFIDGGALFFGQQSRGRRQMRGNGTLIVTDSDVIFQQWVPSREFRIPLTAIHSIENPSSFLGKWQGVPLLKISFQDDSGQTDSMAWRVRDLSGVQRVIEESRDGIDY